MKIRKTRIKKTTKANASVQYVAEYKWGFWWYEFGGCAFADPHGKLGGGILLEADLEHFSKKQKVRYTEQAVKDFIDFYIERVKYQNACEVENKVVKVEYEGYP